MPHVDPGLQHGHFYCDVSSGSCDPGETDEPVCVASLLEGHVLESWLAVHQSHFGEEEKYQEMCPMPQHLKHVGRSLRSFRTSHGGRHGKKSNQITGGAVREKFTPINAYNANTILNEARG